MAKPQWKRVLVTLPSGDKAYRYTDGKGNYRLSHPDSSESMASRRGLSSSQGGPSIGEQLRIMAGPAGGETKTARVKGKPTAGESKPAPPAAKPKPKPSGMANIPPKEANAPVNVQARKPKPAPAASTTSKPKPKPAAPAAAKPKPKPPANTTRSATVMRSPTGKEYAGPAFGERKAESKVGPIADGQKYSVQKTGKSVMQQQADELRKMGTKSESFKAEAEKARKESMAKSLKIKQEAEKKRRKGPRG
jgi:hypothetical protein